MITNFDGRTTRAALGPIIANPKEDLEVVWMAKAPGRHARKYRQMINARGHQAIAGWSGGHEARGSGHRQTGDRAAVHAGAARALRTTCESAGCGFTPDWRAFIPIK